MYISASTSEEFVRPSIKSHSKLEDMNLLLNKTFTSMETLEFAPVETENNDVNILTRKYLRIFY